MIFRKIWEVAKSRPYLFLLVFGLIVRMLVYIIYGGHVGTFNDSENYTDVAQMIKNWDFSNYNGNRTPGYPFLIFLANLSLPLTAIYQSILGILTSFMLYYIFLKNSKNVGFSLLVGLVPSIFLHLLFYERAILSESFTIFCLVFCIWMLFRTDFFLKPLSVWNVFLIGIISALCVTVRPMFLVLPPFIAFYYLLLNFKKGIFHNVTRILLFCLPFFLFYIFWTSFVEEHTGYRSITSFSGGNLAQNTVFYVENADDKYAEIRDIHVRKRDSLIAADHDPAMAIWFTYTELNKKKPLTIAEFSQRLDPMNASLIMANKMAYLKQVGRSWVYFWGTGIMWNYDNLKFKQLKRALAAFWSYIIVPLIVFLKIIFLAICLYHFYDRIKKRKWIFNFELFCVLLILGASVGQALVTFGSNARFSVPFFPLIFIVVVQFYLNRKKYVRASFRTKERRHLPNR